MRLLKCDDTQSPHFTKAFVNGDEAPAYAILSHTWQEGEEVTYDEMIQGSNKDKVGYDKIRFCAQQAKRDGLEYIWVDTCCINKADRVELRDALSSMFRWYQNAARCYVFLSDVLIGKRKAGNELFEHPWTAAFKTSKWFTRGWTLQELLAPRSVEFFSKEWKRLGDKASLQQHICEATRIPSAALQGVPLSQFSVNERLKWSEHRETKLAEDRAYCLMGILGVYISPFEGEGAGGAFRRLMDEVDKLIKCLQDIRLTDPCDDKKRIEDTKGGLLEGSYRWVLQNTSFQQWHNDLQSPLLWIKGDPGKGKTMLLCGIINELQKSIAESSLLCYFFCQATDSRISSAVAVLRGLLYSLISQQPSLASHVLKRYDHARKSLFEDANAWVALTEIFTDVMWDPTLSTTYLIIDALDECINDLPKLLKFVAKQSSMSSRIKWIVSSRNWPDIEEQLERAGHKVRLSLELNAESVSAAVSIFIQEKVSQLAQQKQYDERIRNAVLEHLTLNADNTFLWVALVCQDLQATARRNVLKRLSSFPPTLDCLYKKMMQQVSKSDDAELCKRILASVALVYRPVTLEELVALIEQLEHIIQDSELLEIIGLCGSFLTVRERTIYFVHQSAQDFLTREAAEEVFPSGRGDVHYSIFTRSLKILYGTLHRDMYALKAPGYLIKDVEQPDPDPLVASRYSCIYWIDHLCDSNPKSSTNHANCLQDGGIVDTFLRKKYLYWLECLSLCKGVPKGIVSMARLWSLVQGREDTSTIDKLVKDARRFIMANSWAIETSPLQAYETALVFSPACSLIRGLFAKESPERISIKPPIGDEWSACLQTLESHSDRVNSVAFSPNATRLASASSDRNIRIWDASSGECLQTLTDHNGRVYSVAFSHDSAWLASASSDYTVKIWDIGSNKCMQTLEGHSGNTNSVAFSHDSTQLASASSDRTVKIWDVGSGKCVHTLKGHGNSVYSVAFLHSFTQLASASGDSTIKIWDVSSGKCLQTLKGHNEFVHSVAFSHDSMQLASASGDFTIKIWNMASGECVQTIKSHFGFSSSITFLQNSSQLASASVGFTVKIWDISSGKCVQTLDGHSGRVRSVAFSPNSNQLASASDDSTVRIWDVGSGECMQTRENHHGNISLVTFSHDSVWLATTSIDRTIKIWDTDSRRCVWTLVGHTDAIRSVAFSCDSTQLASGSGSGDTTIKIWDLNSGECVQTLEGHTWGVWSVAFSPDRTLLASASDDRTIRIWDASSGEHLQMLIGHKDGVFSVAFSHDSTWLASASIDYTIRIWDVGSGKCVQSLKGHSDRVWSVAVSRDSTQLASASADKTIKIWDVGSGECVQTLGSHNGYADKFFIASGQNFTASHFYKSNLKLAAVTQPSSYQYPHFALSSDGAWITKDSRNVILLPLEYRPSCSARSADMIAIGSPAGKVWIYKFGLSES